MNIEHDQLLEDKNTKNTKKKTHTLVEEMKNVDCALIKRCTSQLENTEAIKQDPHNSNANLHQELRSQLEFYFGDANLSRDKFLQQHIFNNKKQYVCLDVFLNFKKIIIIFLRYNIVDLKEKLLHLQKSIEQSHLLKLNSGKKNKVKRIIKFEFKQNEVELRDERTIYVEGLPETADHEFVAKIFSDNGKILHVSLPKHENGRIKGFSFVEFQTPEQANAAVQSKDNVVPAEVMENDGLKHKEAIKVMLKKDWAKCKEDFKKIKNELKLLINGKNIGSNMQCNKLQSTTTSKENEYHGCLIKLNNLPLDTDKKIIMTTISSLGKPEYIDWKPNTNFCYARFNTPSSCSDFIKNFKNSKVQVKIDKNEISISHLNAEEEQDCIENIVKKREQFKKYLKGKKINKSTNSK